MRYLSVNTEDRMRSVIRWRRKTQKNSREDNDNDGRVIAKR